MTRRCPATAETRAAWSSMPVRPGVVRLANRMLEATDKASVLRNEEVTAKAVFDAVKAGDELAMEVAEKFGKYLGTTLAVVARRGRPRGLRYWRRRFQGW